VLYLMGTETVDGGECLTPLGVGTAMGQAWSGRESQPGLSSSYGTCGLALAVVPRVQASGLVSTKRRQGWRVAQCKRPFWEGDGRSTVIWKNSSAALGLRWGYGCALQADQVLGNALLRRRCYGVKGTEVGAKSTPERGGLKRFDKGKRANVWMSLGWRAGGGARTF
jgi:hypothetical protein